MKKSLKLCSSLIFATMPLMADSWIVDTQEQWTQASEAKNNLELKKGMLEPNQATASFHSTLKRYKEKKQLKSITIDQSPIWQNWEAVKNVGPSNLGDAPVILSLGPNNYWMFGKHMGNRLGGRDNRKKKQKQAQNFVAKPAKLEGFDVELMTTIFPNQFDAPGAKQGNKGGYHVWQSRDMKNWVHHGAVTEGFSRWVTTAEYVDGKFYIYYDYPNDQDPHLYIDDDLTDGKPGKNMGLAFADPSHGSDCAMIRDKKGRFHVIYEDWTPICARKRSWDSPLAGHAVSDDGIKNFKIQKPAVDNRTTPTGETKTYLHPHWKQHPKWDSNVAEYQVHKPEQEAYGDWAPIAIGGQYYLFGDFDPVGGHEMSVGWFTSSSLDEQFTWCDNIGKGHPDPDICYAEGQFYLLTQQSTDYVSPGPWVENVDVRVGVDTNNDGKVDQWSAWKQVKESYDYTPGFAKQIKKIPAAMDLTSLPAGYGFKFEVKLTDTTENKSKPILDKVSLDFK